jgi:hypothetical protein
MALPLSVLAYLAFILLLEPESRRPGRWLGLAGPLAGFLFLPNDSLPPFLDFAWSGPAFWLGLLLGPLVRAPGLSPGPIPAGRMLDSVAEAGGLVELKTRAPALEMLFHLFILILAWLFLCYYALKRGLPGDLPGFSVFAATPLLAQAGPAGALGLIGLFLALAPFAAARRGGRDPGGNMTRLAISAFLITAFFPFNLSGLLETSAPLALGLDFFLFWGKVILLHRLVAPRLARVRRGAAAPLCGLAGLLLLTAEICRPA